MIHVPMCFPGSISAGNSIGLMHEWIYEERMMNVSRIALNVFRFCRNNILFLFVRILYALIFTCLTYFHARPYPPRLSQMNGDEFSGDWCLGRGFPLTFYEEATCACASAPDQNFGDYMTFDSMFIPSGFFYNFLFFTIVLLIIAICIQYLKRMKVIRPLRSLRLGG